MGWWVRSCSNISRKVTTPVNQFRKRELVAATKVHNARFTECDPRFNLAWDADRYGTPQIAQHGVLQAAGLGGRSPHRRHTTGLSKQRTLVTRGRRQQQFEVATFSLVDAVRSGASRILSSLFVSTCHTFLSSTPNLEPTPKPNHSKGPVQFFAGTKIKHKQKHKAPEE